jgi:hypothetical protein
MELTSRPDNAAMRSDVLTDLVGIGVAQGAADMRSGASSPALVDGWQ